MFYSSNNRRMVVFEELFHRIHSAHGATQHGGRNVIEDQLKGYTPISREALQVYHGSRSCKNIESTIDTKMKQIRILAGYPTT
jgi:hypothetical protein